MSEERDVLDLSDEEDEESDEFGADALQSPPELQGTLSKWTNYIHGWQDRFVVLKDGTLSYYKSENDTCFGCRGAVSLLKASIQPHQFDECRFDILVNDSLWYLRADTEEGRMRWINAVDIHRQSESGYGSENTSLRRQGSMLSIASATSMSTASTSSFKRGRGLNEKLAEMETFRDILCRQVDTLQSYFEACAQAMKAMHGEPDEKENETDNGDQLDDEGHPRTFKPKIINRDDLAAIFQQHGAHAIDFKGESFTFKATTAGILATLSHCIDLMSLREEAWKKRLEKEVERRKKYEEGYRTLYTESKKPSNVVGGPDFEEGPHCAVTEDEFFDAVDATLDKLEKEEENKQQLMLEKTKKPPNISLDPSNKFYAEINKVVDEHIRYAGSDVDSQWELLAEEGEMKVFRREQEEEGLVIDPLKAIHTVKGVTGHELCHYFWNVDFRLDWEGTLEGFKVIEWASEDTVITHNIHKRVWPTTQRDSLFWSHIRHVPNEDETDEGPDYWIVCNYSTEHLQVPLRKCIRIFMNVALVCDTVISPPTEAEGPITRDDITCKIQYLAMVNPGGWAPASVLRAVYKREYPKFLKRFTQYVIDKTKDKPILL